jgi:CDP-glucose 4,6-dehydratase
MEMVVLGWQQLFRQFGGMYPVSLRAGNVIGGGDFSANRLLPDIVRAFDSGIPLEIRNPTSVRPWQHVLDPLYGYLLALEWTLNGNTTSAFNFGPSGEDMEVRGVVEIAKRAWPEKFGALKVRYVESEFHESGHLSLDSTYTQHELGWKPRYSQVAAVESTINWWNKNLTTASPAIELCKDEIDDYLRIL